MSNKKSTEVDRKALKTGVWYFVSEILVRGISFLCTPVFTRLLSKSVYGDVKTYESWLYLLNPILSLGIYNSIERARFDFRERFDAYISSGIFMVLLLNVLLGLACFPFGNQLAYFLDCPKELVAFIFLYTVFYTSILCVQKRERQMFQCKNSVLLSVLSAVLPMLTSVICVMRYKKFLNDEQLVSLRILSFYVPVVFVGMAVTILAFARGKKLIDRSFWLYGLKFSSPFILYSISMQVLNQSDKIMIKKLCGSDDAGIYAVATTVVYIMDVINNAVQGAWMPWMFEKLHLKEKRQVQAVWNMLLFGMGSITWLIVMAAPELIFFLGGSNYGAAVWLIAPMVTGSLIHFITVGYTNVEKFYKKTGCAAAASLCSMAVNLLLNYVFIARFGYRAAAYTTASSYFAAVVLHSLFMKKCNMEDVLPVRPTIFAILFFACINFCMMSVYQMPFYVRWFAIFTVLTGMFVKNRKNLTAIISRKRKHE